MLCTSNSLGYDPGLIQVGMPGSRLTRVGLALVESLIDELDVTKK